MQKALHYFLIKPVILFLFLGVLPSGSSVLGQVALKNDGAQEIRFTRNSTTERANRISISLSELDRYYTADGTIRNGEWAAFGSEDGNEAVSRFYDDGETPYVSAGKLQLHENDLETFFALSFRNDSEHRFESSLIAFDFKYHTGYLDGDYRLSLNYKINDNPWRKAEGGTIRTETISGSGGGREWDTFSVQLQLDDIYLRPEDQLHLKWVFEGEKRGEPGIPLVLEGIEIVPERSTIAEVDRGDLVITEIMPYTEVDGTGIEYIEVYNPGDQPVPLKGMEIAGNNETRVIHQNLEIPPYGLYVLSNIDLSGIEGVENSLFYDGELVPSGRGRVELIQFRNVIASATYEATDEGVALEMDAVLNAYDGYSSLQNLQEVNDTFYPGLYGTPGRFGNTVPLYKKTLAGNGWHFIAPPGTFVSRLNRNAGASFYSLKMEPVEPETAEPYTPLFVHIPENRPVELYVEAVPEDKDNGNIKVLQHTNDIRLGLFQTPDHTDLRHIVKENEEPLSPVVLVWNEKNRRFDLRMTENSAITNWSPFIYREGNSGSDRLRYEKNGSAQADVILERVIPIQLFEGNGNDKILYDEVMIGFMDAADRSARRYDLPRMQTVFPNEQRPSGHQPMLYLTSPVTGLPANQFIHLPYEPAEEVRAGIGYEFTAPSGAASLQWNIDHTIPDDWTIRLEDTQTGTVVDMREVNRYRFRYTGTDTAEENAGNDKDAGLTLFKPSEQNRFVVTVEPLVAGQMEEEEAEETPGSVELRQNYPNPFNPSTTITFYLPEERPVKVGVYNIVGQQVALLIDESLQAGEHSVVWDAGNKPSGIYIVQLETGSRILSRKITLIK